MHCIYREFLLNGNKMTTKFYCLFLYCKTVQARYHRCYTCCQRRRHRQSTRNMSTYFLLLAVGCHSISFKRLQTIVRKC